MSDIDTVPTDNGSFSIKCLKIEVEQLQAQLTAARSWRAEASDKLVELTQALLNTTADRDRLRTAIEQAPHGPNCASRWAVVERHTFLLNSADTPACNCWKRAALEPKP